MTLWHIAKLHNDLLTTGSRNERRGGLALKTVRNTGRVLTTAFGDPVRLGLVARNLAEHVEIRATYTLCPAIERLPRLKRHDPQQCSILHGDFCRGVGEVGETQETLG